MNETFLYYVWQYQYINKPLYTIQGDEVVVLSPGNRNYDQGPDFLEARVKIGNIEWIGHVEMHIQSSDWYLHKHEDDKAYDQVILHIVWKHTEKTPNIATVELCDKVETSLLNKWQDWCTATDVLPCSSNIPFINRIIKISMFDRVLTDRLDRKANDILHLLKNNQGNWRETAYQLLGKSFGFEINKEPFLLLTQRLHVKTLLKHADNVLAVESMLLGCADIIDRIEEDVYRNIITKEYTFYASKFGIIHINASLWKYSKTYPSNFPHVRIRQLARLICKHPDLALSIAQNAHDLTSLRNWFVDGLDEEVKLGKGSTDTLIINVAIPLMIAYSRHKSLPDIEEKAMYLLEQLPAENNKYTREIRKAGFTISNATDSQAAIQLLKEYCTKKRCLECQIGSHIIKS